MENLDEHSFPHLRAFEVRSKYGEHDRKIVSKEALVRLHFFHNFQIVSSVRFHNMVSPVHPSVIFLFCQGLLSN